MYHLILITLVLGVPRHTAATYWCHRVIFFPLLSEREAGSTRTPPQGKYRNWLPWEIWHAQEIRSAGNSKYYTRANPDIGEIHMLAKQIWEGLLYILISSWPNWYKDSHNTSVDTSILTVGASTCMKTCEKIPPHIQHSRTWIFWTCKAVLHTTAWPGPASTPNCQQDHN